MDAPAKRQKKKKKKPDTSSSSRPLNPNWVLLQQKLNPTTTCTNPPKSRVLGKRKERTDEATDDSEPNPLIRTSTDFSVSDVVAMDCEMVGVGEGIRRALGRLTLVNKWGNVICDEFVRPLERITDFRTQVSGIRPSDMRKAKDFRIVQKKVAELIKGKVLVGHALHNDLKALLLSHPKKDIRDTSEYHLFQKCDQYREGRRSALRHLATEFLSVTIQKGEHCLPDRGRTCCNAVISEKTQGLGEKHKRRNQNEAEETAKEIKKRVKMGTLTT